MLYFRMPNVTNNNFIIHKVYLFIFTFSFYSLIQIIKKFNTQCKLDYEMLHKSFLIALYSVIGYSFYVDMLYWDKTKDYFGDIEEVNQIKRFAIIALIITLFIATVEITGKIFYSPISEC